LQKKPLLFKGAKYIRQELSSVSSIGKNAEGNSPEKLLVISQWHDAGALSQAILQKIKSMKIFPTVHFPSYGLISIRMIRQIVKSTAAVIEISVQSHDLRIRRAAKCAGYTNSQLERWLEAALRHNIKRVELYFTIGLPYQNEKSVRDTVSYCLRLLKKFRHDKRVVPFIMPILFLDPGSPAFDNPEKYGYRLFARTLGDHINNFTQVDFRDRLNYETRWLSRGRIVDLNFYAIKQITRAKIYYGYLGKGAGGSALERIEQTQDLLTQLARLKGCGVSKKSQEKIFRKVGRYNREGLRSRMPEHKFFYNFWYQI
jgi:radical SAM superfamily enzyme YgiQ (UPF0313 family)